MQHYSETEGKIYIDPSNCSDCSLRQLNNKETDACGGLEETVSKILVKDLLSL